MSDRQSIIGFTEAELGFFLALLCLILFVAATAERPQDPVPTEEKPAPASVPMAAISEDSLARLASHLRLLEARIDTLTATIDTLRGRRSTIKPTCAQRGVADGPLFTITVLAPNRFRVGTDVLTFDEVLARTAPERRVADRAGCVHQLRVAYLSSLPATEYDAGRRRITGAFRTLSGGSVPE